MPVDFENTIASWLHQSLDGKPFFLHQACIDYNITTLCNFAVELTRPYRPTSEFRHLTVNAVMQQMPMRFKVTKDKEQQSPDGMDRLERPLASSENSSPRVLLTDLSQPLPNASHPSEL